MECVEVLCQNDCAHGILCSDRFWEAEELIVHHLKFFLNPGWFSLLHHLFFFFFCKYLLSIDLFQKQLLQIYRVRTFHKYYLMVMFLRIEASGKNFALINWILFYLWCFSEKQNNNHYSWLIIYRYSWCYDYNIQKVFIMLYVMASGVY